MTGATTRRDVTSMHNTAASDTSISLLRRYGTSLEDFRQRNALNINNTSFISMLIKSVQSHVIQSKDSHLGTVSYRVNVVSRCASVRITQDDVSGWARDSPGTNANFESEAIMHIRYYDARDSPLISSLVTNGPTLFRLLSTPVLPPWPSSIARPSSSSTKRDDTAETSPPSEFVIRLQLW